MQDLEIRTRNTKKQDIILDLIPSMHWQKNTTSASRRKKHKALCGSGVIEGVKVILAKPQTYMNLSGESIAEIVNFYKLDPESEMLIIFDDISLAPGNIRVRKKGQCRWA